MTEIASGPVMAETPSDAVLVAGRNAMISCRSIYVEGGWSLYRAIRDALINEQKSASTGCEPRGCPPPGACSCVTNEAAIRADERRKALKDAMAAARAASDKAMKAYTFPCRVVIEGHVTIEARTEEIARNRLNASCEAIDVGIQWSIADWEITGQGRVDVAELTEDALTKGGGVNLS